MRLGGASSGAAAQHAAALLPAEDRLRACEVCTPWRAALSERHVWARVALFISRADVYSDTTEALLRRSAAVLRSAATLAGGALRALRITACSQASVFDVLRNVAASVSALEELCLELHSVGLQPRPDDDLCNRLLEVTPRLRVLELHGRVVARYAQAAAALRREGGFSRLRLVLPSLVLLGGGSQGDALSVLDALRAHPDAGAMRTLCFSFLPAAAVDALAETVGALTSLRELALCTDLAHAPGWVPAVARVLALPSLRRLELSYMSHAGHLFTPDAHAAAALADALRRSRLRHLVLFAIDVLCADAAPVLAALTAHPSLQALELRSCKYVRLLRGPPRPASASARSSPPTRPR